VNRIQRETREIPEARGPAPAPDAGKTAHFVDYFAILREHKWIAMLPFALILGATVVYTLFSDPVYSSRALIEIEPNAGKDSLLGELSIGSTHAKVEAEMEVMQSRTVAQMAAEKLAARGLGDFLVEVNAHRPLEVMLAAFGRGTEAVDIELTASPVTEGPSIRIYEFTFEEARPDGRYRVAVDRVRRGRFRDDRETEIRVVRSGEPFSAFDHSFTLAVDGEPPVGRSFEITLRNRKALAGWLRGHTTVVEQGRNTGIVGLSVEAPTPRMAQASAKALADSFVEFKRTKKRDEAAKAANFLKERLETLKADLEEAEAELEEFQDREGISLLSERAKLIVENIAELERERVELDLALETNRELERDLRLNEVPSSLVMLRVGAGDPAGAQLAEEVTRLELAQESIDDDLTDRHPEVVALRTRLAAARERLRRHVLARIETEGAVLERRKREVVRRLGRAREEERTLPSTERELASRTREVASIVSVYSFLTEKGHEAEIARESVLSHVSVLDEPVLPGSRVSPNLLLNLLVGTFLATLAALGTAFFAEYLDRSIKTPEELEETTGLPLYAALPSFKSVRSRELRRLKSQMVTIEHPHSVLSEGYRSLRANVKFADFESPVRTFAITSAVLGEGKTTTTLNLATVLAQAGSRVVVVDADLRRPATHAHLNGTLSPGLTEVLVHGRPWREVVHDVEDVEGLHVIHGGKKPDNPGALLDSDRFQRLLSELKEEYDYVVFDVPPVLAVADAAAFFSGLDAVFLLVQWRRCPVEVVLAARDQIVRLGANLRGVIFNGFDARKSGRRGYGRYGYYGYYGGYRYGYGYGYHGRGGDGTRARGGTKVKSKS